jgi:hypothetical protein
MDDARLIEVVKILKAFDLSVVQKALDSSADRNTLLASCGVTADEFAEYLSQEVDFQIDNISIKRPRKQVLQAMHSCC